MPVCNENPRLLRHCWLGALLLMVAAGCDLSGSGTADPVDPGLDPGQGEEAPEPGGRSANGPGLDFSVRNEATRARTETILASVPFPQGACTNLLNLAVSGHKTAWLPLQRWADGTVKVAQAQFTDTLAGGEARTYVVAEEAALTGEFTRNASVGQAAATLELGAEVRETFHVPYWGFAAGAGSVVGTAPLARGRRRPT